MSFQHVKVPAGGQKITVNKDSSLNIPDNPIIPAGLFAITLGSSVDAAAPANAFPSAETLFSRNWKPDPRASPSTARLAPATAKPAASLLK